MPRHVLADDVGGVVAGAVVNHQHFAIPFLTGDVSQDFVEGLRDALALVISGDDDGVRRSLQS